MVYSGLLAPLHGLDPSSHRLAELVQHFSPLIANRAGRLVLETLDPLPGDRKCFRMINGVLVERTVKDVVPALRTNAEGLKKVLDDLVKQYKAKQDELEKWKVWTNCRRPCRLAIGSDPLCRRRTTSRLCSHEPATSWTGRCW